jgi:hypothetical protein
MFYAIALATTYALSALVLIGSDVGRIYWNHSPSGGRR